MKHIPYLWLVLFICLSGCSAQAPAAQAPTLVSAIPPTSAPIISPTVSPTSDIGSLEGLKSINGTHLYYKTMGKGEPLFFLHGRSGSHRYFLPHFEPLADDYQLFLYDQRGTGLSDGKIDLKAISIDQFVEDLESLHVAFGFEKISLLAHSRGSMITLSYALKYQEHVDKLILIDPWPVTNTFLLAQSETLKQRVMQLDPKAQTMLTTMCQRSRAALDPEVRSECLKLDAKVRFADPAKAEAMDTTVDESTVRNEVTVESLLMTSFSRKQQEIDTKLKTLAIPTLIIHGDFDPIPLDSSKYIQQRIPGSQLVVVKQGGHFPFVEQPETVVTAIRGFLQP